MIDPAEHTRLAHSVAHRMTAGRHITDEEREDVHGDALEGLVKAARDFDASHGLAFSTYATARIRGQILDGMRRRDHLTRKARATAPSQLAPLSLDAMEGFDVATNADDLDRLHDRLHAASILRRARRILTRRQAAAIAAWLDEDTSQVELARAQGVTESAVHQAKRFGLAKMRKAFA